MTDAVNETDQPARWPALVAAIVSLFGIADATYLAVHHYTVEPVACSLIEGCEMVLTSPYATLGGIPLALFGLAAYFLAFSLAILTVYGDRRTWLLYGIQTAIMAAFSIWLIYVQAALIGWFCQFCLISAGLSFTLFIVFVLSKLVGRKVRPS